MTKFADAKFSVGAPLTEAYDKNYARTFSIALDDRYCTECKGEGYERDGDVKVECVACQGTGLRAYQRS
jgi:DnaJ-class molecular chaperone